MTLLNCIEEARPAVLGIFLLRFSVAALMTASLNGVENPGRLIEGGATWESAIFFVYIFNGVMDVREDRINGSGRPIARGALSRGTAVRCSVAAAVLALVGAAGLGVLTLLAVIFVMAIGWQYSGPPLYLKRRPVGAPVACLLLGLATYSAGFLDQTGAWSGADIEVLVFALVMSGWMGLVGAPAKDLSDTRGDAAAGRRTLAVLWGEARVRALAAMCALALAGTFAWTAWDIVPSLRWPSAILAAGALAVAIAALTRFSKGEYARRRLLYRMFMVTQYAVHVAMALVLIRLLIQ